MTVGQLPLLGRDEALGHGVVVGVGHRYPIEGRRPASFRRLPNPTEVYRLPEKLLEEDVRKRPAATVSERRHFLTQLSGKDLSGSTVRRVLKRLGFGQKTERGGAGAGRVAEGRLEGDGRPRVRYRAARVRGRDGDKHLSSPALRLVTEG